MTMLSTSLFIPSKAMISLMCSRKVRSPCPPEYCKATAALSDMSELKLSIIRSLGNAGTKGMPPARETTSGLDTTANKARTSEADNPLARDAYLSDHKSLVINTFSVSRETLQKLNEKRPRSARPHSRLT